VRFESVLNYLISRWQSANNKFNPRGGSMRRVATAWKVIKGVLKENAHSAYKALRPPARVADIRALEELTGTRLPQAVISSLRIHDGMQSGVNLVDYNSLLPVTEMGRWWRITMDNPWDEPGPRLIDAKRIKGDLRWRKGWVPIAVDAGGNLLACDLDPGPAGTRSQMFSWQNYGSSPPKVVAESYMAWLDAVAEELLHRRFTIDEWGGMHLRKRLA
jgi:cell wall assembly regulator SMI1